METKNWSFEKLIVAVLFFLIGLSLFRKTPFFIAGRIVLPSLLLFYLVLKGHGVSWFRLSWPARWFLLFLGYLFTKSLFYNFVRSNRYWEAILESPIINSLWILELHRIWGLLILLSIIFLLESDRIRSAPRLCFYFFCWVLFVALVGGYLPHFTGGKFWTGETFRIFNDWHTNSAKTLNLYLFVALGGVVLASDWSLRNGIFLTLFYGSVGGVYLTQSRGGIGSLFLGLILFLVLYLYKHFDRIVLVKSILVVLGIVVLIGALPEASHRAIQQEVSKTKQQQFGTRSGRWTIIWPAATELISRRPVFGHSVGSYRMKVDPVLGSRAGWSARTHPHNFTLQVLYDGGIVGLAFLLGLIGTLLYRSVFGWYRSAGSGEIMFLVTMCTTLAVVLSHGLVEAVNYGWLAMIVAQFELADTLNESSGSILR